MIDKQYIEEIVITSVVLLLFVLSRFVIAKLIRRFAKVSNTIEHRTNFVIKYINILLVVFVSIILFIVWGIQASQVAFYVSSVSAIIGVAMFAQWSILSNITAGIVLFFNFPFKIGDVIRIHDKDFPVEGEIIDIKAFHALLKTLSGEIVTYPNNLLIQKGITIITQYSDNREFTD